MNDDVRLDELLADRATQGLSDLDEAALALLVESEPGADVDRYECTAAALDLALNAEVYANAEPMPAHLVAKLDGLAARFLRDGDATLAADAPPAVDTPVVVPPTTARRASWGIAGWLVAAAAIAVMASGLFDEPSPAPGGPTLETVEAFVRSHPDALVVDWGPGGDVTGAEAGGRVVWSQAAQEGFMVFDDLAVNDVSAEQYQLWIFDAERQHPVDGGVFDIRGASGQVVAIDAKLPVAAPTLFAVTVERPGGVVVSSKGRITLAADPANAR